MQHQKTLIVYYSRSGTTRRVAQALQRKIGGDILEIGTKLYPEGVLGFLEAMLDAALGRAVPIVTPPARSDSYDLILLGTPVWGASLPSPMRTFLSRPLPRAKKVAFFLTYGGSGADRVFSQMEELCGKRPSQTLALKEADVHQRKYAEKVEEFARAVGKSAARLAA
ncbi:MAG: flavodoxin family protein [Bdellovibrionota bacterium]